MSLLNTQKQQATGVFNVRSDEAQQALILREKQAEVYFWQELENFNCDEDYEDHIPTQKSTEKRGVTNLSPRKLSSRKSKHNQKKDSPIHEDQLKHSASQDALKCFEESSKKDRNTSTKKSSRHHDSSSKSDRYAPYPKKHSPRHSSNRQRNHFKDEKVNNSSKFKYNKRN